MKLSIVIFNRLSMFLVTTSLLWVYDLMDMDFPETIFLTRKWIKNNHMNIQYLFYQEKLLKSESCPCR